MTETIDVLLQLRDQFSGNLNNAMGALNKFEQNVSNITRGFTPLSVAAGGALAMAGKFGAEWQKASDTASRGLDLSGAELEKFKKQTEDLAATLKYQLSSTELLNLATDIGKLGVATKDIGAYETALVKVGVATDKLKKMPELGTNIAKIGGVFRFSADDVLKYGAAVNKLDDSTSATADEILNYTKRVAGIASTSKISAEATSALGATLISSGQTAETAATFSNKLFTVLGAGTNLSKDAQASLQKLGYSAKELAVAFDKDAQGTMVRFMARIKELDTVSQREILGKIFGQEHVDSALLLTQQVDSLNKNLAASGDAAGNIAKLNSEFDKLANQSLEGQMNTLKNQMYELGKSIGLAVLPGFLDLTSALTPLVGKVAELVQKYPMLSTMIASVLGIVAVIAPLGMIVSSVTALITSVGALNAVVVPFATFVTANLIPGLISIGAAVIPGIIAALGGMVTALGAALLPFAPIIAAATALGATAYLIITNWDKVKQWFTNFGNFVRTDFNNLKTFLQGWGQFIVSDFQNLWTAIKQGGSNFINFVKTDFQNLWIAIDTGMKNFLGQNAADWERLKVAVGQIWVGIGNLINQELTKIKTWFQQLDAAWFGVLQGMQQKTTAFTTSAQSSWTNYTNFLKTDMQNLNTAWSSTTTAMQSKWSGYTTFVKNDMQNLDRAWFSVLGGIKSKLDSAINSMKPGWNGLVEYAKSEFQRLLSFITSLGSQFQSAGASLVSGFTEGIRSKIGEATAAAANMAESVAKYLPHSDAERGALSTLSQTGRAFVNTFLQGIQQSNLTGFLNSLFTLPRMATNTGVTAPRTNGGGIVINLSYAPTVNGSRQDAETIINMLRSRDREVSELVQKALSRIQRTFY